MKLFKSNFSDIIFYFEDVKNRKADFNGETVTFTLQQKEKIYEIDFQYP